MALKFGMLGVWHAHAPGIVRQIAAHPQEFSLAGFWDPDPTRAARRLQEWTPISPGLRVFDTPQELLRQPLDGVIVEGRVFENVGFARQALEAGFPVLLEKPAGENLQDFERLVELAQRKQLRLQVLYLFRYMSAVREMLARGRSGELGQIYEFRGRLPKDLKDYPENVESLGRYRGGIFFEMAGHLIDMQVSLLGRPKKITPFLAHHHDQPGDFVDHGVAVFEYPRAWGLIEVPALEVAPHARRIEVYGTSGACVIPHLGSGHLSNQAVQPVDIYRAGSADWDRVSPLAATLQIADLREFAQTVSGQKPPEYSFEHDLIVHESLLRASGAM